MNKSCIIFFAKYPEEGYCKTRIAGTIGFSKATSLYRAFIEDMLLNLSCLNIDIITAVSYASPHNIGKPLPGTDLPTILQNGENIGIKMYNAFSDIFTMGYSKAFLTGSDIPGISHLSIADGFCKLEHSDIVFGPSADGGYYAVGTTAESLIKIKPAFTEIEWNLNTTILQQSVNIAFDNHISVDTIGLCNDIDTMEDLINYKNSHRTSENLATARWLHNNQEVTDD